jgi:hypothetical protein
MVALSRSLSAQTQRWWWSLNQLLLSTPLWGSRAFLGQLAPMVSLALMGSLGLLVQL